MVGIFYDFQVLCQIATHFIIIIFIIFFFRETDFADQAPNHPFAGFNDTTFQYSSIPLPPLTTSNKWFNELPEEFFKKIYRYV